MSLAYKIKHWRNAHHPAFLDLLRLLLGVFLFLKGFAFMQNLAYLQWVLENEVAVNLSSGIIEVLMYYIAFYSYGGRAISYGRPGYPFSLHPAITGCFGCCFCHRYI